MTQPTQHPWHVTIDDTGGPFTMWPSIGAADEIDATIVHRAGFKQEHWGNLSLKEATANAHLMAAAPELRDLLTAMYEQLKIVSERLNVDVEAELVNSYKSIIAKSKGTVVLTVPPGQGQNPFWRTVTPSAALAAIVGPEPLLRTELTKKVWEYIKTHNLQDPANRRLINTDANLKLIFGQREQVSMFDMIKLIATHIK